VGRTSSPLMLIGSSADWRLFLVKWMKAVLSPSKDAPLLLSHSVARYTIAWRRSMFSATVLPTIYAV
jgi:hypothetical protein